jgi:hypothetical protein
MDHDPAVLPARERPAPLVAAVVADGAASRNVQSAAVPGSLTRLAAVNDIRVTPSGASNCAKIA